jgi:hypothetical protein
MVRGRNAYEQCLTKAGHLALDYLEFCQAQLAACHLG